MLHKMTEFPKKLFFLSKFFWRKCWVNNHMIPKGAECVFDLQHADRSNNIWI